MEIASLVNLAAVGILAAGVFWGILYGGRRQLMNLLLLYAAIIFAFQHCATAADILSLIFPDVDYLALQGILALVLGLLGYVFLLAFSMWVYGSPTPLSGYAARASEKMTGLISGLLQGWIILVLLGITAAPLLDYLLISDPNKWQYFVVTIETTSAWNVITYSTNILIPLIRPWLLGPSLGLLTGWE
jgi:hypothetical protein